MGNIYDILRYSLDKSRLKLLKRIVMEFVYVGVGIVIGVAAVLLLDVGKFAKKVADEEEKIDDHNVSK